MHFPNFPFFFNFRLDPAAWGVDLYDRILIFSGAYHRTQQGAGGSSHASLTETRATICFALLRFNLFR